MSSFSKTAMHSTSANSVMHKPLYGYFEPSDSKKQSALRNHLVAASGECIGTYMFFLLAFLGHSAAILEASSTPISTTLYTALAYSSSFLVTVQLMYGISGGFFNPMATLGLVLCGELPPLRGIMFFPVQFLGAVLAGESVRVIVPGDVQSLQTLLGKDVHLLQGLFLEMILTAMLVFAGLILAAEDFTPNSKSPIVMGITYFVAQLAGATYTGASLNPLRSLAPCIASRNFTSIHWIYWVGPFLGALLASSYYHLVRYFNYHVVESEQEVWFPSETSPLLQTRRITESPGPASPRSRRQSLTDPKQRGANDSQERGDDSRKQHYPHYPFYRYRRDGRFDLTPKQEPGRRFSDGRIFVRAQRQEQAHGIAEDETEQMRRSRGKGKLVAVDV